MPYDSDRTATVAHKVLLVDDDDAVRAMMNATLEHRGFEVVAAASVTEALRRIATESFDVLITDLHMPNPGDGFTVVTAMRHSQPNALTLLVSGYPDVQSAMAAILLEADEIMVKPFAGCETCRTRPRKDAQPQACSPAGKGESRHDTAALHCPLSSKTGWCGQNRAKNSTTFYLSDDERTGHLPKLVEDLVVRLSKPSATKKDSDAVLFDSRYSPWQTAISAGLHSRHARARITNTPGDSLRNVAEQSELSGFQLALPDVMTIADEVDAQLTQSMDSYMEAMRTREAA